VIKTTVVIPAYNESAVIQAVVQDVINHGFSSIIVVDDGSSDDTGRQALACGALLITHRFNRGKGAAIKTGLEAAKLLKSDIIVTMDADGQHQASDINALIEPIIAGRCDVVLGSRVWRPSTVPKRKIMKNMIGNAVTWLLHRQWVTDSQSGLRAYSRRAACLIDTQADFYDYDSEVIREIRHHNINFMEVPITVRYTPYSQSKPHKQNLANGLKTAYRMVWHLIS